MKLYSTATYHSKEDIQLNRRTRLTTYLENKNIPLRRFDFTAWKHDVIYFQTDSD